jgi:hypothetical protein
LPASIDTQGFHGEVGMDVVHAASRLRSLASNNAKRSKTAVLADVFVEIENAIRAGVSQVVIVDELRRLGLDINLGAFRSALRRLRASRAGRSRWDPDGERTDFVPTPFGTDARSVRTTSSGSLYDESAMHRLLRARSVPTARAASALAD